MCNIGTSVRLCFGVSCDIYAGAIVLTSRLAIAPGYRAWPSYPSYPSRLSVMAWLRLAAAYLGAVSVVRRRPGAPGCGVPGRRRPRLCCLWTCRRRVVSTRRRMLVFAMVLAWSM